MPIQIFGHKESLRVRLALVVAEHEGITVEHIHVNPKKGEGLDSEPYASSFPVQKVPTLIDGDVKISELIAVTSYLASINHTASGSGSLLETAKNAVGLGKASLLGSSVVEKAHVLQWVSFFNMELATPLGQWFQPLIGAVPYNKKHSDDGAALFKKRLDIVEQQLLHNTFLVTERVTLADLYLASIIQRGSELVFDPSVRSAYPNVFRHYNTIARTAAYKTVGLNGQNPTFVDTAVTYTPPAKTEKAPKAEKAPAAPKAAAAPKADKKKKDDDEEEEDDTPKEVKAKHPIEGLGSAKSFPLDEWKRQYSNLDTPEALKWFDEHYDAQDYSLWHAVYKYPEELTQVFMSSNLITGFHSRLEASRKYLFGNAGVYGKKDDSKIQGVYLVRGSDGVAAFDVAPDYESYTFSLLDWTKAEDRKLVEDVWKWEGEFDGKPFADGKTFK